MDALPFWVCSCYCFTNTFNWPMSFRLMGCECHKYTSFWVCPHSDNLLINVWFDSIHSIRIKVGKLIKCGFVQIRIEKREKRRG